MVRAGFTPPAIATLDAWHSSLFVSSPAKTHIPFLGASISSSVGCSKDFTEKWMEMTGVQEGFEMILRNNFGR
jgi:hypothetical protein